MRSDKAPSSVVTFRRAYPGAIPIMKADRSALGTIPSAAFQYCEALCSASAFGWYVFPPVDIRLRWNGGDVFYDLGGGWEPLASVSLLEAADYWDENCPADLRGKVPPFLSSLFVPGVVQVWSGLLVSTAANWSLLVRPPANVPHSNLYGSYEGIIETDTYGPAPLFTNIRLIATDVTIELPRMKPLFQVQPIQRSCYADVGFEEFEELREMSESDWNGFRKTIRSADPATDSHRVGQYAVGVRKRGQQGQ